MAFTQRRVAARRGGVCARRPPARITIRDAATLEPIGSPIEPEGFAGAYISQYWTDPNVALTPDGRSLVTASDDGELAWWDLDSREKTRTIEIEDGYRALALSPDGRTAAIGIDGGIQLIDVRTGAVREAKGALAASPIWLLFSPDGKTVVSTNLDGTVTLWDAGAATPSETLRGHSSSVRQPVFSPDGETLYTASHDGTAIAWDLSGDRRLGRRFTFTHDRGLSDWPDRHPGRFSPDGRLIAVGLKDGGIGSGVRATHRGPVRPSWRPAARSSARVQPGRANARGRHQERHGDALGRRIAIAPPGAVSGRLVCRRREHQRGRDDARHGRRRAAWSSGTSRPAPRSA